MLLRLPYKTKQFFFVLIKLSIVVGAFYFIYTKLTENEELSFSEFWAFLTKNDRFSVKITCFLLILSSFNWFFEIVKWQNLVSAIKRITLKNSLEQTLGSLTASIITPNRIGEYGAKAMYFEKPLRKRILFLNLLGNLGQMAVTTLLGCVGLIVFINKYDVSVDYYRIARFLGIVFIVVCLTLLGLGQRQFRIKGYTLQNVLNYTKEIALIIHLKTILLSLLRYLTFSFQFFFLMTIFQIELDYLDAMALITSMYFLASIIPTISILDVIVKGSVAVFVFSYANIDELRMLSIITLMWILNFAIPSILGSYYVLKFKLPKTSS